MAIIPKWTGVLVGKMHNAQVTNYELAEKLGCSPEWVSKVLTGAKTPKLAKEKFNLAFQEIVKERGQ